VKSLPALFLILLVSIAAACQAQPKGPVPIGAGAYPVTPALASAWFGDQSNESGKKITLLVFFQGEAGWHNAKTDFGWHVNTSPATINMNVAHIPLRISYSPDTQVVSVQGHLFNLSHDNVYLVEHVDSASPIVRPLGTHDMSFKSEEVPSVALLKRDANVWAAIARRPLAEHHASHAPSDPALAALDQQGLQLLLSDDPASARKGCELLRQAATKGYARSQYRFGYCYESGSGGQQDFSTANEWYERAANQGDVDAQYKLAHSYRTGRGVKIDLPVALDWYKKAAANGDSEAQYNVGMMYATGQGVTQDSAEAYRWYLQAAESGEAGGQFEVARRLADGDGVQKDPVSAFGWLLVLEAQKESFQPSDWEQVEKAERTIRASLDTASINRAAALSRRFMSLIADHDLLAFARSRD
jgi:hypothetical protein